MRLFRSRKPQAVFDAPIAPEEPFYAVGDLHGCDELFLKLLHRLHEEAHPTARLICVGDYVDRGDDSAGLLARLHRMQTGSEGLMVCLMGNHERMLLDFLEDPAAHGFRWQRNGGLQTLASYGLRGVPESGSNDDWAGLRDKLARKMGPGLIGWLQDLPLYWQTGNVVVAHAGAEPDLPIEEQGERELLWGRSAFFEKTRGDGLWVVHGHVITRDPKAEQGRIPLDTGAYATGRLTAALIEPQSARYLEF
ncbi:metallophosphoesterase [Tropicibacter sp. S64]|uniref:metallophosphoesterase n=1 Tax=Tropicibacter sp. S64 TaxID=3415122 RepID=UPI003C7D5026